jgi:membrane associated rhomboid family serine protease
MRRGSFLEGDFLVLGGRVPRVVGVLIGLTLALSILGALGGRESVVRSAGVLVPALVWSGQVWRLITWMFFESEPISLLFSCLMLWWFGRDLIQAWGSKGFLGRYLAFTAVPAALTVLLSLVWTGLGLAVFAGQWAITGALVIAWATLFPSRQLLLYFVFPLGGRNLVYITFGTTILFALFYGPGGFVPHLLAEGLMLVYLRGVSLQRLWLEVRYRLWWRGFRKRSSHLRAVERDVPARQDRWLH